jgi:Alkylmercury lyase
VEPLDLDVRRHVYSTVAASGRPPSVEEAASSLGIEEEAVASALRRLHDAHALVLYPGSTEIWAANPFCFAERPHRVTAAGRSWTGTCCWDALGIPAALHADGRVETECACCGDPLRLTVVDGELSEGRDLLAHFVVPAGRWWDDIVFT